MSKFKKGDKVISIMNTPQEQEGFIGTVVGVANNGSVVDVLVDGGDRVSVFAAKELALLGPKTASALDKQISGNHYKDCGIQPIEYIHANGLDYFEGNAVKYITRHRKKNGKADIEKAIHYLELLLELEYKDESK